MIRNDDGRVVTISGGDACMWIAVEPLVQVAWEVPSVMRIMQARVGVGVDRECMPAHSQGSSIEERKLRVKQRTVVIKYNPSDILPLRLVWSGLDYLFLFSFFFLQ